MSECSLRSCRNRVYAVFDDHQTGQERGVCQYHWRADFQYRAHRSPIKRRPDHV